MADEGKPVIAVKGFDPDLSCLGHKFEVGKTYTVSGEIKACENGFHACENPLDVWSYYPIVNDAGKLNRWAVVEMGGQISRHADNSKIASAEITIKAELTLPEFIGKAVNFLIDYTKLKAATKTGAEVLNDNGGNYAQIGSSGDCAQIGSSGDCAQIGSSGNYARIGSSGDCAQIGSSGYCARIGSSGDCAQIGSSGNYAQIGSSGNYARIGSSGDYARIGSSGYCARIVSEGANAVIASAGNGTTVSGKDGTWISLAEFDAHGKCVGFATGCIGKDGLEPDTAYRASGGKLVKA